MRLANYANRVTAVLRDAGAERSLDTWIEGIGELHQVFVAATTT
jgi:hypothetical protein